MKKLSQFSIFLITAICLGRPVFSATAEIQLQMIDREIERLTAEKNEKTARLESCAKSTRGFKIAGISTLALTGVGIGVNISQYNIKSGLNKQIENERTRIRDEQIEAERKIRDTAHDLTPIQIVKADEIIAAATNEQRKNLDLIESLAGETEELTQQIESAEQELVETRIPAEKLEKELQLVATKKKKEEAENQLIAAQKNYDLKSAEIENTKRIVTETVSGQQALTSADKAEADRLLALALQKQKEGDAAGYKMALESLDTVNKNAGVRMISGVSSVTPNASAMTIARVDANCSYTGRMTELESNADSSMKNFRSSLKYGINGVRTTNGIAAYNQETNSIVADFESNADFVISNYESYAARAFDECPASKTGEELHNSRVSNFVRHLNRSKSDGVADLKFEIERVMKAKQNDFKKVAQDGVMTDMYSDNSHTAESARQITGAASRIYGENAAVISETDQERKDLRAEIKAQDKQVQEERAAARRTLEENLAILGQKQTNLSSRASVLRNAIAKAESDLQKDPLYRLEPGSATTANAEIARMRSELATLEPELREIETLAQKVRNDIYLLENTYK